MSKPTSRDLIHETVRLYPGITSRKIAVLLAMRPNTVRYWLVRMRRDGQVTRKRNGHAMEYTSSKAVLCPHCGHVMEKVGR